MTPKKKYLKASQLPEGWKPGCDREGGASIETVLIFRETGTRTTRLADDPARCDIPHR